MTYVFNPAPLAAIPVRGSDALFPVRRVFCVGRNYADHAREMGHDPTREEPFFFARFPDTLVLDGTFPYPGQSQDVHHEVELVVCLGQGGDNIPAETALSHIFGYAVGLDMTRRDLQAAAKKAGKPWEVAKSFDNSAPISPIAPAAEIGHPNAGAITLSVNGTLRQSGDLSDLTWNVPEIIAHLSRLFRLAPGDIIMTGTPAGVGAVVRGDRMAAAIAGVGELSVSVV